MRKLRQLVFRFGVGVMREFRLKASSPRTTFICRTQGLAAEKRLPFLIGR
jgi:hypothetical protein